MNLLSQLWSIQTPVQLVLLVIGIAAIITILIRVLEPADKRNNSRMKLSRTLSNPVDTTALAEYVVHRGYDIPHPSLGSVGDQYFQIGEGNTVWIKNKVRGVEQWISYGTIIHKAIPKTGNCDVELRESSCQPVEDLYCTTHREYTKDRYKCHMQGVIPLN